VFLLLGFDLASWIVGLLFLPLFEKISNIIFANVFSGAWAVAQW
jgi:hypothetical protein